MYHEIVSFISSLNPRIFATPIFSISFLRLLPAHIRQLVFDLVCTARHLKLLPATREVADALRFLRDLRLVERRQGNLFLDSGFRDALLQAFRTQDDFLFFRRVFNSVAVNQGGFTVDVASFERNMESLVRAIIDGDREHGLWQVVVFSELVGDGGAINNKGFEFLLLSKNQKLWFFVLRFIEFIGGGLNNELIFNKLGSNMNINNFPGNKNMIPENKNMVYRNKNMVYRNKNIIPENKIEKLTLCIFEMGMMEVGIPYEITDKSDESIYHLLTYLKKIGLVSLKDNIVILNNQFFSYDQSAETVLIVETNYKFYAYLNNDYAANILQLFGTIHLTLPNLIVGQITEDSVQEAFDKGITGAQIINYLKTGKQLPSTVADQIILWENKKNRVKQTEAYLYKEFSSIQEFEKVLAFCRKSGSLIEYDRDKKIVVSKVSFHESVKSFIKTNF